MEITSSVACGMRGARRRRLPGALALPLCLSLASCAGVHINSPSLEATTAKAAAAMPAEAAAMKPFDEQLSNLSAFAGREDLGVARYWTDVRDAHFVRLIAMDGGTDRRDGIAKQVERRLEQVLGRGGALGAGDPVALAWTKADAENVVAGERRNYVRDYREIEAENTPERRIDLNAADAERGGSARPSDAALEADLACTAVTARVDGNRERTLLASGKALSVRMAVLAQACRRAAAADADLRAIPTQAGELGEAQRAAAAAAARTAASLPDDRARRLQATVDQAEKFAETDAAGQRLAKLLEDLKGILETADAGAKVVGWNSAAETLDDIIKARLCASEAVDDAAKEKAKCGEVEPTSTTGRIAATWGLAKALAQLADANAPARRSTLWLLAAKAVVAARKADAELELQQARAVANAERVRAVALWREASLLLLARQSAAGPRGDCHDGRPVGRRGGNASCQLAAYVDAWNEGRIPAMVLRYRPIQIEREFTVRRARAAALKEYVLASSGVGTLQEYGASGIKAALIAQALFDAALLGVNIGEL